MAVSFTEVLARKVVSRSSADRLGELTHVVIDPTRTRLDLLVVGKGKHALVIDWENLVAFGPDAVITTSESVVREASSERDRAAVDGKLDIIGKLALSSRGMALGTVRDVEFDADTGVLSKVVVGNESVDPGRLLAVGSYAAIIAA